MTCSRLSVCRIKAEGVRSLNKRNWILTICLGLLCFAIGGLAFGAAGQRSGYIPPLKIVGDVAKTVKLEDLSWMGKAERFAFQGENYRGIKLVDLIREAEPLAKPGQLYLAGSDGFTSAIKAEGIEKCYITFTAKNGWEAINLNHPISSNAKLLKEIVVVADSSPDFGLTVINQDADLISVTPGQLYTRVLREYFYPEGQSSVQNEGKVYETAVYTKRRVFQLGDLTPVGEGELVLVIGADGEHRLVDNSGYFELKDNYINYFQVDSRSQVERVQGVMVDPPAASIMDTYYDARHFLESGEKVIVIVLDGLTYNRYTAGVEKGELPFFKKMGTATKAAGVYPPAANVWLAAMITGKFPGENGVVSSKDQDLKEPSLFAVAAELNKRALLLDAGQKILNTEVEPVICSDQNASGTADDELYAVTLEQFDKRYDLVIVHFQGIAASGKRYIESLRALDQYLEGIVTSWPGRVIVTAGPGGVSKAFCCETMFVPYWCN